MSKINVSDYEAALLDQLLDCHEMLLNRELECDRTQARELFRKWEIFRNDMIMFLAPDLNSRLAYDEEE